MNIERTPAKRCIDMLQYMHTKAKMDTACVGNASNMSFKSTAQKRAPKLRFFSLSLCVEERSHRSKVYNQQSIPTVLPFGRFGTVVFWHEKRARETEPKKNMSSPAHMLIRRRNRQKAKSNRTEDGENKRTRVLELRMYERFVCGYIFQFHRSVLLSRIRGKCYSTLTIVGNLLRPRREFCV